MSTFTNPLKQHFAESGTLFGLWLSLGSADAAEALAHAGFDWLCIDMEHSANDSRDVIDQLRAIAAAHLPSEPIVRVPAAEGWIVKRVLDAGARTLMFPNVESAADAQRIVRLTQYPTADVRDGLRGAAGAVRAAAYGMRRDYMTTANAQIATIVQIESAAALEAVDAIAATPGIDCLFIGPADLAASLGHLGDSKGMREGRLEDPARRSTHLVVATVEVGLGGDLGTPAARLVLADQPGIEVGVDRHLFARHGVEGEPGCYFSGADRAMADY